MWVIMGILIIGLILVIIEVPSLLKRKLRRETIVFLLFLFFSIGLSIYQSVDKELPSPLNVLRFIYTPIKELVLGK